MSDLFARVQSAFHHRQAEFLKIELETGLRSAHLASRMYDAGNSDSAERTTADAEESYAMVLRFLSDPKGSKCLTIKATQEFTVKIEKLRKTLDDLRRFRQ